MAKPKQAITNTNPRLSLVPPSDTTRPGSYADDDDYAGAVGPGLDAVETRELERRRFDRGEFGPGELDEAGESSVELESPDEGEKPPLSPAAKVGIGAGVVAGAGLLGYGVYALGKRAGWWGSSAIVFDEDDSPLPSPKDDDARPSDGGGGGGGGGGGSTSGKRARGNPPNVTGDTYGYNSTLFPAPLPVRVAMKAIGYPVEINSTSLYQNNQPDSRVSSFQADWNRVIKAIDAGKINLPSVASHDDARWVEGLRGLLEVDGIPGKRTLCALEIALSNQVKNGLGWRGLVEKA